MKPTLTSALPALPALTALLATSAIQAQIAGTTTVGTEITNVQIVTAGWSAKKQILG